MPISIVVGGQYGSEGKGKLAHWLAEQQNASIAIRVGGPNSGHTAVSNETTYALRQLPTPSLLGSVRSIIPSGAYIDVDVILREITKVGVSSDHLLIHPYSVCIEPWMREEEVNRNLLNRISSTGQGVGSAVANRAFRDERIRFAKDVSVLAKYVNADIGSELRHALDEDERIVIEGTQGFGLSNLHSGLYPYATSRDTSASGALSEAGLSPVDVDCVALVIRSYPIRVAGNSGPLPMETSWEDVTRLSGAKNQLVEHTTVTGNVRRIGCFDGDIVRKAIVINNPTHICLNHVDYFDYGIHEMSHVSQEAARRVGEIESSISRRIDWVGTGPSRTLDRPRRGWATMSAA